MIRLNIIEKKICLRKRKYLFLSKLILRDSGGIIIWEVKRSVTFCDINMGKEQRQSLYVNSN